MIDYEERLERQLKERLEHQLKERVEEAKAEAKAEVKAEVEAEVKAEAEKEKISLAATIVNLFKDAHKEVPYERVITGLAKKYHWDNELVSGLRDYFRDK